MSRWLTERDGAGTEVTSGTVTGTDWEAMSRWLTERDGTGTEVETSGTVAGTVAEINNNNKKKKIWQH